MLEKIKCYRLDTDDYPQTATSYDIDRIQTVFVLQGWREGTKYYRNETMGQMLRLWDS
jgi:hypothetical protein